MQDFIEVIGAKQHNLKNINVKIPKNQLVVFTGVSGSGKSSLAFDTIFAEGQRRYIESLNTYARQFLGQLDKPNVENIEGLSPAISIDQKSTSHNPRSTVGTVTEIYDHLRLLFARIGTPHCPKCGDSISTQTVDEIVDNIIKIGIGAKIQIIAPVVRGKKGEFANLLQDIKQDGFMRVKIDGEVYNLEEDEIKLTKTQKHNIGVIVDRIVIKETAKSRIADSVQIALKQADGLVLVDVIGEKEIIFSEKLVCPKCNMSFDELEPRMFSFNNPFGACEKCAGLGAHFEMDPNLIIPDTKKSLNEGAIYPWAKTGNEYYVDILKSLSQYYNFSLDIPFEELSCDIKKLILYGNDGQKIPLTYKEFGTKRTKTFNIPFKGVIPMFQTRYEHFTSETIKAEFEKYMSAHVCSACNGARLKPFSLAVTIFDKSIYDVCTMSIEEAYDYISSLFLKLDEYKMKIAQKLLNEIRARLKFLLDVGLGYLTLARSSNTLSGGEAQRIRLATQIGSGLSGVLYVLDEPSIGLHQMNNQQLLNTLIKLRNLGNTLIVVEHDEDTIKKADWIVDIGPKAGELGGEIVAEGTLEDIKKEKNSITGQYLSGEKQILIPKKRRQGNGEFLRIKNAHLNNLKNIDVDIPLGGIVTITGVSGSGKSTLVFDLLNKYAIHHLRHNTPKPQGVDKIDGFENIDKIIDIDQSPIGRTPRSNPATYTGVFSDIRDVFAMTNEAKLRGYKAGRFSFNVKGGRCEACSGDGIIKIEMNFLPDVYVPCEVCGGKRYNRETLEVKYKGKTISDVLDMTVKEALDFFENIPKIKTKLQTLNDVGLEYIHLGQSATTLSGGEAQRVKLATELLKRSTGKTLYLLDEPSVGLHWHDINKLAGILQKLADSGNTIIIIEHNLDLIKISDYIIDLGPEGGSGGGTIVAKGTPEDIAKCENSATGFFLKKILL